MEKATRQYTKGHNRNLVLKTIFEREQISRAETARLTGLTRSTVSEIVSDLMDQGLIHETGFGQSQGGKNPILLGLVEDSRWLIGLNLAQHQFRGAVVNLRGKLRGVWSLPVNDTDWDGDAALRLVYQILDQIIDETKQPLSGIGVGAPGLINTSEGMVVNAVNLHWKAFPLAHLLQERYHLPVQILNDCQAAAIGEKTYGRHSMEGGNLVLINVHHGIGAGIIINGTIFRGDGGFAGEIGHVVVVEEGGELCSCGRRGCLETVASARAVIRQARQSIECRADSSLPRDPAAITLEAIETAFRAGDPLSRELVLKAARYLGMIISSMVGALNIQRIILQGDMTRFGALWLDTVRESMMLYSLDWPLQKTSVEIGQLGENAVVLGAAAVFANNYSHLISSR